ncbi:MAG: tRNA epoxyqueuosine(34) reductase QueG [Planctomycetota bacterium]
MRGTADFSPSFSCPPVSGPPRDPHPSSARRSAVLEIAHEVGFDLAGLAPLDAPPDALRFERWLDEGRHGTMAYLERARRVTVDPRRQWPTGRSLLVVGFAHSRASIDLAVGERIARYAAGRDYHNVVGKRLQRLRRRLQAEGLVRPGSAFVDATPLLERSHAARAGLGTPSKAANLLDRRFGPWFFLGEIVLETELEPSAPIDVPSCGTCTACIDACPTDAIVAPGEVDATLCISYATIEHAGLVPHELRERTEGWAFGCDVCSEVCPWGSKAPDLAERFGTRPEFEPRDEPGAALAEILEAGRHDDGEAHANRWRGSPLRRPGREGVARNAAVALGTRPSERGRDALLDAVEHDPSPVVRAAAAWALSFGHRADRGVAEALERALSREVDAEAADDMRRSLERRT